MYESYKLNDFSVLCKFGGCSYQFLLSALSTHLFVLLLAKVYFASSINVLNRIVQNMPHTTTLLFLRNPIFLKRIKSQPHQGLCSQNAVLTVEAVTGPLVSITFFGGLISFEDKSGIISYSFDI